MPQRNKFSITLLSVIVPAYNQEKTIVKDVKNIQKSLQELGYAYEIIVVVDGIVDRTYQKLQVIKSKRIKIFAYDKNQGKGHAIKYGMLRAKGNIIGFIDAGRDIHPSGFKMLLNHMEWYNADVIVGSKLHPVSKVAYPLYRKIFSWGYRKLTRLLFGFQIRDTQVGLKFFKREVVRDVLPKMLVKRYAFDIELLTVAYNLGYRRIFEAPVDISFRPGSITKRKLFKITYLMLWDTAAVFYRLRILHYYSKTKKYKNIVKNVPVKVRSKKLSVAVQS